MGGSKRVFKRTGRIQCYAGEAEMKHIRFIKIIVCVLLAYFFCYILGYSHGVEKTLLEVEKMVNRIEQRYK
jgi:hypothetical protein